jgi:hypothetical protein
VNVRDRLMPVPPSPVDQRPMSGYAEDGASLSARTRNALDKTDSTPPIHPARVRRNQISRHLMIGITTINSPVLPRTDKPHHGVTVEIPTPSCYHLSHRPYRPNPRAFAARTSPLCRQRNRKSDREIPDITPSFHRTVCVQGTDIRRCRPGQVVQPATRLALT